MENKVSLPTRMSFLTTVEAGLRKSSASLREADRKRRAEEKRAAKGKGTEGSAPVGSAGVKNRDDSEEDAVARGSAGAGENGIDSRRGGEERVILRAAREALEKPRELGVDVTGRDDAAGLERSNNNIKGRIPWERMLEFLMSHDGVDSDGNGEAIRSYLRRISWIEQQKKLQPVHSGAVEALQHGVQSWLSMPEAMRVQREMQRMRAQRKRFRRPQKEKSSG
ncbi:hypothetical protein DQ04_03461030 [Trypanosoma grayi]|uniref:hypothetical protein n=1 Tax=Trypanosoma grayi TaxID=71804 RepID=UPI0004F4A7D2|nr:hypothetical protein DQ04_03461030 [Trypanosoma grayi]KEG10652.1 hypothetical protein DQ04_03461030 [Trypanosoma grayi]